MIFYLAIPDSDVYDSLKIMSDAAGDIINRFRGEKLADSWKPQPVSVVRMKRRGDFPSLLGDVAFSQKAWDELGCLLQDSVEILPLVCKEGTYYAVNILTFAPLDLRRAKVERLSSGKIIDIQKYVFNEESMKGKHIAMVKEMITRRPIVSDAFKNLVEQRQLQGLLFKKLT